MSDDESMVLWLAVGLTIVHLVTWYRPLVTAAEFRHASLVSRLWLVVLPVLGYLVVLVVVRRWAGREVRESDNYVLLFVLLSSGWWILTRQAAAFLGVRFRDDVIERCDPAATVALSSALVSTTLIYAGANIGEGDTIWTTIVPALAGTAALLVLWLALELMTAVSDAISLDGDMASAVRLGGFLVGSGLILARAVAGDFHSWPATLGDLAAQGWPVIGLAVITGVLQRLLRPTPMNLRPAPVICGLLPSGVMLMLAVLWVMHLGWWR